MSATELTNVLEERLVHYETGYDVDEVGKVLSVGDGIIICVYQESRKNRCKEGSRVKNGQKIKGFKMAE